MNINFIDLSFS